MTAMIAEVYDALRSAGVPDEKAIRAAEALAAFDPQLARVRSDIRVLKWQVGVMAGMQLLILGSLLAVWAKLGEIGGQVAQIATHLPHA